MKIGLVPPENVSMIWPTAAPMLERAVNNQNIPKEDMADLLTDCLEGRRLLWVIYDTDTEGGELVAVYLTSMKHYPMYKALVCEYLGGSRMEEWIDTVFETMLSFATKGGCDTIEINGRRGWERKLTPYGFNHSSSTFEKKVRETIQ